MDDYPRNSSASKWKDPDQYPMQEYGNSWELENGVGSLLLILFILLYYSTYIT